VDGGKNRELGRTSRSRLPLCLGLLTIVILGYCLASALNARATYLPHELRFEYYDAIRWLPHSYDRPQTWQFFWRALALACFFWAARDWLLGKTRAERREMPSASWADKDLSGSSDGSIGAMGRGPSQRLGRLVWVLTISGGLLAAEGMVQRWSRSDMLLWIVQPKINRTAEGQFGPYAYRSNAAQYLNLVWPVSAGFCGWLGRRAQIRRSRGLRASRRYLVLIPFIGLMAISPVVATTRGGAIVAGFSVLALAGVSLARLRRGRWTQKLGVVLLFLIPIELALFLGWTDLGPRFASVLSENLSGRSEIYENARSMAEDFPWLGSGPGTFMWLYYFYRGDRSQSWQAFVHDDWLETRITFGRVGLSFILLALGVVATHWRWGRGITSDGLFVAALWISLGGCLLHACYDLPLQIYSIQHLFLLICCVAFSVVRCPHFGRPSYTRP